MARARVEVVTNQITGRSTINISRRTKNTLDTIKRQGQSYDGLIQELVQFWRDKKGEYWTRRKEQRQAESTSSP